MVIANCINFVETTFFVHNKRRFDPEIFAKQEVGSQDVLVSSFSAAQNNSC